MPGYPTFPKPPESLGRIVVLESSVADLTSVNSVAASTSIIVGSLVIPFNFDCEGGYSYADKIGCTTSGIAVTVYLYEGTTKIGSASLSSACATRSSVVAGSSAGVGTAAITLASGYQQFAAGTRLRVRVKNPANCNSRGARVVLVGMKVDKTYGYRA